MHFQARARSGFSLSTRRASHGASLYNSLQNNSDFILFYQQRVNSLTLATLLARNSIWQSENLATKEASDKRERSYWNRKARALLVLNQKGLFQKGGMTNTEFLNEMLLNSSSQILLLAICFTNRSIIMML